MNYLIFVALVGFALKRIENNMFSPNACQNPIGLMTDTADTRHSFQSHCVGHAVISANIAAPRISKKANANGAVIFFII